MKNNIILSWVFFLLIGFTFGYILFPIKNPPIIKKVEAIEQTLIQDILVLAVRNSDMKKGQFVYLNGVSNNHFTAKKLENSDFPPPETIIYVVHSFDGSFVYLKRIAQ